MQAGGCAKFTRREPCAVEPFAGARFHYLAANVVQADGSTIFPATGLKRFDTPAGPITIGFIGMTLKGTANLVTPSGVKRPDLQGRGGDRQRARAASSRRQGRTRSFCSSTRAASSPIHHRQWLRGLLWRDPGDPSQARPGDHDHRLRPHALGLCLPRHAARRRGRLLTSAGKYGYFVTDLRLEFDPATHRLSRPARARMSPSATASAGLTRRSRRWSTATPPRSRRSASASSAISPRRRDQERGQ